MCRMTCAARRRRLCAGRLDLLRRPVHPRFEEPGANSGCDGGGRVTDIVNATPMEPMVRFRLRTILVATTLAAVLAGFAGWYFRRQAPTAQQALLVYWGVVA